MGKNRLASAKLFEGNLRQLSMGSHWSLDSISKDYVIHLSNLIYKVGLQFPFIPSASNALDLEDHRHSFP